MTLFYFIPISGEDWVGEPYRCPSPVVLATHSGYWITRSATDYILEGVESGGRVVASLDFLVDARPGDLHILSVASSGNSISVYAGAA